MNQKFINQYLESNRASSSVRFHPHPSFSLLMKLMSSLLASAIFVGLQIAQAQEFIPGSSFRNQLISGPLYSRFDSLPETLARKLYDANTGDILSPLWDDKMLDRNLDLDQSVLRQPLTSELQIQPTAPASPDLFGKFASMGSLLTTEYYGQAIFDGNTSPSLHRDRHRLELISVVAYVATGLFELISDPP